MTLHAVPHIKQQQQPQQQKTTTAKRTEASVDIFLAARPCPVGLYKVTQDGLYNTLTLRG